MDIIGPDCEKIILDYKYQLEHTKKFKNCIKKIKNIKYRIRKVYFSTRDTDYGVVYYNRQTSSILKITNDIHYYMIIEFDKINIIINDIN
jgi:hypothetical protein